MELTKSKTNHIITLREKGYRLESIARNTGASLGQIRDIVGQDASEYSAAYATIHTGSDKDRTGKFKKYATMRWINV